MEFGSHRVWVGAVGLSMGVALALSATQAAAQVQTPAQQQGVPEAPAPQALPKLSPLSAVGPAVPQPQTPGTDQAPVPSNLAPPLPPEQHPDDGPPPEGSTANSFKLAAVNVQFVQVPFTVKDSKGRLVPGLTWRDVRLYENNTREPLRFFTVDPFPLSVAIVIDQSVTYDTMEKINDSLSALQAAFTPYDEVALFTYNNGANKRTDFTAAQSKRLTAVLEVSKGKGRDPVMGAYSPLDNNVIINNQAQDPNVGNRSNPQGGITISQPKEYHTLLDAIFLAAQTDATAAAGRRRIVFVISDGKEYGSKVKEKELIRYLQTNKIEVYATLVGDSSIPGAGFLDRIHLPFTMRDDVLPRICSVTGGEVDPEFRPKGIEASFARITEEVRTQYTAGYYTHASPFDERFRKIEVRVMRPGLTVIAKDGYYPSASDSRPSTPVAAPVSAPTPGSSSSSTPGPPQ
jgi:VWFA-related protein